MVVISYMEHAPKHCFECDLHNYHFCDLTARCIEQNIDDCTKPNDCPLKELPSGKWIEYDNSHCECPFCHTEWSYFENMTEWFDYCPKCGAHLVEEQQGENK